MFFKKDFRIHVHAIHIKTKKPIKFNIIIYPAKKKLKRKKNRKEINKTENKQLKQTNNIR